MPATTPAQQFVLPAYLDQKSGKERPGGICCSRVSCAKQIQNVVSPTGLARSCSSTGFIQNHKSTQKPRETFPIYSTTPAEDRGYTGYHQPPSLHSASTRVGSLGRPPAHQRSHSPLWPARPPHFHRGAPSRSWGRRCWGTWGAPKGCHLASPLYASVSETPGRAVL